MSWFSQLKEQFDDFDAGEALGKLNEISNKVQSSLPLDDDLVNKLTLRSADLKAEHDLIDSQETRKEMVRDYLSSLLPWETRDETRDILVEDCELAIREMAKYEDTFTGPFDLPEGLTMFPPKNQEVGDIESDLAQIVLKDVANDGNGDGSGNAEDVDENEKKKKAKQKLEKMGTLPSLLDEFDLDAHVGLIERLFHTDQNLVEMHSRLTSAGKTEKVFWKNYFFHCAYHRYDKGLSVEEIWVVDNGDHQKPGSDRQISASDEKPSLSETISASFAAAVQSVSSTNSNLSDDSIELTFEEEQDTSKIDSSISSSAQDVAAMLDKKSSPAIRNSSAPNLPDSVVMSDTSTYEIVETAIIDTDALDEELDELEAEIARELGEE